MTPHCVASGLLRLPLALVPLLLLSLQGCAPTATVAPPGPSVPAASTQAATSPPAPPTPIAARVIELAGYCSRTEEDGFREEARMRVASNEVQALSWKLWVSRRGSCAFDLADFRQTRKAPHIELQARDDSGCKLMVWQDPRRVTLAHANCQQRCTPGIYEEAWPVMFDPGNGMCAQVR
nr:hypothetical protein [Cupriavidus gilardii]